MPALRTLVDDACRESGATRRGRAHRRRAGADARRHGPHRGRLRRPRRPLEGRPTPIADELRAYAREGIGHVQLVLDPIDPRGPRLAPVLAISTLTG